MIEFTIETNVLRDLFKRLTPFTAKDDRRPILQGICCEVRGKSMKLVALDGHILIETSVPINNEGGEDGQFVLPVVDKLKKSKEYDYTRITVGDKDITLTNANGVLTKKRFAGDYVKYNNFYPQKPADSVIYMDPALLAKVLRSFPKGEKVQIQYRGELQPLLIRSKKASTLVYPMHPIPEKEFYNGMVEF